MNTGSQRDQEQQRYEIPIPDIRGREGFGRRNPLILPAVACAVLILIACAGIVSLYIKSTPAYRLGKGIRNLVREMEAFGNPLTEKIGIGDLSRMLAEEGGHVSTRINFTADGLIGNTIGVDTEYYKDMQNKELSADTSISMMNYEFAHLNIYADEEAFCFSVPELFLENMYVDNENIVSQYNASFLAGLSGSSPLDDFSVDLFPDADRQYVKGDLESYAADLEACRKSMVLERIKRGVYRVIFPSGEMERLLRDVVNSCEPMYAISESGRWWKEYDRLLVSDICMIFTIDRQNHIELITLEEPVSMLDGKAVISGALYLPGSTQNLQGDITVKGEDGMERSLYLQIIRSRADEGYGLSVQAELMKEEDSLFAMKYVTQSDVLRDAFTAGISVWNDREDQLKLVMEGRLDDIVQGRSLELELENMQCYWKDEEIFKMTGDILLEPLEKEIRSTVKRETNFFEMTERDWLGILYKIGDTYGSLPGSLW